ncbi:MAG: M28 family peptidase [Melioribacteraceae bacterium]|nr:M28 family peptidase [Melioribacteraceae bacterium]
MQHLKILGSDIFEGRGTGTIGSALAAKYLALRLEEYGLIPAGNNSTYYQYIPMHGNRPLQSTELILYSDNQIKQLQLYKDYFIDGAGDRSIIPAKTELIFAGYGIIAPEYDYNDYENIDVEDKIVVFIDGEPNSDNEDYFTGPDPTVYSYPGSKQRLARSRGAIGTIHLPLTADSKVWEKMISEFYFEDVRLAYSVSSSLNLFFNNSIADWIFNGSAAVWDDILKMHLTNKLKSFPLNKSLTFKGEFKRRDFIDQNVLGLIEGSTRNDELIIVSAHYDHLGIGLPAEGDSVYNGVFDNAIGCAAMLEAARLITEGNTPLKRSVLFLFVTGEEKGLLGSRYYTDHPFVPLHKTAANINIDGVPFIDEFKSIVCFGYDLSTLKNNVDRTAAALNLSVKEIPQQFSTSETFNRSDQIAFANAGIPSILIMDAADYVNTDTEAGMAKLIEYSENIYHTPFDDLSQKINYKAVVQYVELIKNLIVDIANDDNTPEWNKGINFRLIRLRTIAEKR